MGNFSNNAITDVGKMLLADVQAGGVFVATRIVLGSGNMPGGATTQSMTGVITPVASIAINKKKRTPDGKCIFGGVYTNREVTAPFYFRELALYAKAVYLNEDGTVKSEGVEILYSYGNAGETADYMPAYSTSTVVEKQIDLVTWVGNDAQVDLTIETGIYITHEDFDNHASRHAVGGEDPITPESIGALPLDGRTSMTGPSLYLYNRCAQVGANEGRAVLNSYDNPELGGTYRGVAVFNKNDEEDITNALCLAVRNPGVGEVLYPVYGKHNKPTPADIGAVNRAGGVLTGNLRFENFNDYYAILKGRTIDTGQTHFLTVGVGVNGSTALEHYTCDSETYDATRLDCRLELHPVIVDGTVNSHALMLKSHFTDGREFRIYGEHYSPAVVATAELI